VLRTQEEGVKEENTSSSALESAAIDHLDNVCLTSTSLITSNGENSGLSLSTAESEWGEGAAGAWGSDSGVDAIADSWSKTREAAIEQATAMSVLAAQKREASLSAAAQIASKEELLDISAFPNCFPAFEIETYYVDDEEVSGRRKRGGDGGDKEDDDSDDDDEIGDDEREKQHAKKLLSEYESWAGKVVVSATSGTGQKVEDIEEDMGPVDDTMIDDLEDENNNGPLPSSPSNPTSTFTQRQSSYSTVGGGGGGGGGGESYERLPPKVRHMLRFQKVLAKAPEQVLRYEWDGEPLWPVPPKVPAGECTFLPPRCVCGSDRKFELQLMPHLLMGLCPEDYSLDRFDASTNSSLSAAASLLQGGGAGMDFLTALVYSCESSCKESQEEFIYVVPGGDNRSESFAKIR